MNIHILCISDLKGLHEYAKVERKDKVYDMKIRKRLIGIVSLVIVFSMFFSWRCCDVKANLITEFLTYSTSEIEIETNKDGKCFSLDMGNRLDDADSITIESSDEKIVKVDAEVLWTGKSIGIYAEGVGKATVTVTVKKGKETKKYAQKVKVVKYSNAFKQLKIGKSNLAKKADKFVMFYEKKIKKADKLKIKLKSDWKIKEIELWYYTDGKFETKKMKNNTKIKFPSKASEYGRSIVITVYNKKTKNENDYIINCGD